MRKYQKIKRQFRIVTILILSFTFLGPVSESYARKWNQSRLTYQRSYNQRRNSGGYSHNNRNQGGPSSSTTNRLSSGNQGSSTTQRRFTGNSVRNQTQGITFATDIVLNDSPGRQESSRKENRHPKSDLIERPDPFNFVGENRRPKPDESDLFEPSDPMEGLLIDRESQGTGEKDKPSVFSEESVRDAIDTHPGRISLELYTNLSSGTRTQMSLWRDYQGKWNITKQESTLGFDRDRPAGVWVRLATEDKSGNWNWRTSPTEGNPLSGTIKWNNSQYLASLMHRAYKEQNIDPLISSLGNSKYEQYTQALYKRTQMLDRSNWGVPQNWRAPDLNTYLNREGFITGGDATTAAKLRQLIVRLNNESPMHGRAFQYYVRSIKITEAASASMDSQNGIMEIGRQPMNTARSEWIMGTLVHETRHAAQWTIDRNRFRNEAHLEDTTSLFYGIHRTLEERDAHRAEIAYFQKVGGDSYLAAITWKATQNGKHWDLNKNNMYDFLSDKSISFGLINRL